MKTVFDLPDFYDPESNQIFFLMDPDTPSFVTIKSSKLIFYPTTPDLIGGTWKLNCELTDGLDSTVFTIIVNVLSTEVSNILKSEVI